MISETLLSGPPEPEAQTGPKACPHVARNAGGELS